MNKKNVLIIKHGYSTTCDHSISPAVSLSETFSTTCILHAFKDSHVTWITIPQAFDLLADNYLIDKLILADSPDQIPPGCLENQYHTVINLEKQKDFCLFASALNACHHYGYKDWTCAGTDSFFPESQVPLSLLSDDLRPIQDTLYATINRQWTGQKYLLGYQPKVTPIYDIGLNYRLSSKMPTRAWPRQNWHELNHQLSEKHAVSFQPKSYSIRRYVDWLASCKTIITNDSLGLHLSLAMNKQVVAIFGPTHPEHIYMFGQGVKISPLCDRPCIPCQNSHCHYQQNCISTIDPEMVIESLEMLNILNSPQEKLLAPPEHTTPKISSLFA